MGGAIGVRSANVYGNETVSVRWIRAAAGGVKGDAEAREDEVIALIHYFYNHCTSAVFMA